MRAIARMGMERAAIGKHSTFQVRGRKIDLHEVLRYWHRKGVDLGEVYARHEGQTTPGCEDRDTPPEFKDRPHTEYKEYIECSTPPEPVECATSLPTSLQPPEVFAMPERIFTVLRSYHLSTSETGVERSDSQWRKSQRTITIPDLVHVIDRFHFKCWLACQLCDNGSYEEAGEHLSIASRSIDEIVRAEHPHSFTSYLRVIVDIRGWGRHEIGTIMLQQASKMGEVLLSETHPLSVVYGWLASLDQIKIPGYGESVFEFVRETCGSFKETLGQLYRSSTETRLRYPKTIDEHANPDPSVTLSALVGELGDTVTHEQSPLRSARTALARFYLGWEKCPEVEEAAQALIANKISGDLRLEALEGLADALYDLSEMGTAEHRLREAIKLASAIWAAATQTTLRRLEDWLAKSTFKEAPEF